MTSVRLDPLEVAVSLTTREVKLRYSVVVIDKEVEHLLATSEALVHPTDELWDSFSADVARLVSELEASIGLRGLTGEDPLDDEEDDLGDKDL